MEPKYFENSPFEQVIFSDKYGNKIIIYPQTKSAWALFKEGTAHLTGIPQMYKEYFITFGLSVTLTADDIDAILQWRCATNLRIIDHNDLVYKLMQQIEAMSNMNVLESFSLSLNGDSYAKLSVKPFLEKLRSLRHAHFTAETLTYNEIDEFINRQEVPREWQAEAVDKWIVYTKNVTKV